MDVLEIDVPLKWIHEEMSSPGPHVTCPPAEMIQVSVLNKVYLIIVLYETLYFLLNSDRLRLNTSNSLFIYFLTYIRCTSDM